MRVALRVASFGMALHCASGASGEKAVRTPTEKGPEPTHAPPLSELQLMAIRDERLVNEPGYSYGARPQVPSPRWRRIDDDGPFPFASAAKIRGYTFTGGELYRSEGPLACPSALVKDGTFCPSMSFPGIELSNDQANRLLGLLKQRLDPKASRAITACDFTPHHAFVVFDRAGTPIAELEICFDCGEWKARPSQQGKLALEVMPAEAMYDLCREVGLARCWLYAGVVDRLDLPSLYTRGLITRPDSR